MQSLPLVERPAQVAGVVKKETEDALAVAGQVRKSKVGRLIAAIGGRRAAAGRAGGAGRLRNAGLPARQPTQDPGDRHGLCSATLRDGGHSGGHGNAHAADRYAGTGDRHPAADGSRTPTQAVVLPPAPAYRQPDRLAAALAGINAGAVITTGESVSNSFAISDMVAMVDDGDLLTAAGRALERHGIHH